MIRIQCLLLLLLNGSVNAQSKILSPSQIYKLVEKSTVTIVADNEQQGSGFYVAPNVIATNYHVIEEATEAHGIIASTNAKVRVIGYVAVDKEADLILLKVSGSPRTPLKMAKSKVVIGQTIYTVGAPLGMSGTISNGMVSAIRNDGYVDYLQITAPISSGSSGSPVVNRVGEVVGISTLTSTKGQNLNFAVSHKHLQELKSQIRSTPIKLAYLKSQNTKHKKENDSHSTFSIQFAALRTFHPTTLQTIDYYEGHYTVFFNVGENKDVVLQFSDGSKVYLRRIEPVINFDGNTSLKLLDESGNTLELILNMGEKDNELTLYYPNIIVFVYFRPYS